MLVKIDESVFRKLKKRLLFTAVLHKLAHKWFSAKYKKMHLTNKQTKTNDHFATNVLGLGWRQIG